MEFRYTDPSTDFSNGLQVIKDYHEDFLARGIKLLTLAKEIKQQSMSEPLANQCMDMYCHYSHANNLHHKDEEEALFPVLVNHSELIIGMIERLIMDHEEIEKSWDSLAEQLSKPERITNFDQFLLLATEFEKIQREHLTREDEDFLPKIEDVLSADDLEKTGLKMLELRHIKI